MVTIVSERQLGSKSKNINNCNILAVDNIHASPNLQRTGSAGSCNTEPAPAR
jgi:hypothetical protein